MEIPWQKLPTSTLESVIEAFVLTEGTEYGLAEVPLRDKVAAVKRQLQRGEAVLKYNEDDGTCSIYSRKSI